jgi:hypothetical protein
MGKVNSCDPTASARVVEALPGALAVLGVRSAVEVVGSLT